MVKKRRLLFLIITGIFMISSGFSISRDSVCFKFHSLSQEQNLTIFLSLDTFSFLSNGHFIRLNLHPGGDSLVQLCMQNPANYQIYTTNNTTYHGLIYPGETRSFDLSDKEILEKLADGERIHWLSQYYKDKSIISMTDITTFQDANSRNYLKYLNELETDFKSQMDYLIKSANFISLNKDLKKYELNRLQYHYAFRMVDLIQQVNLSGTGKLYANPELLLWFRDFRLNNSEARNCIDYYRFLASYFLWKNMIFSSPNKPGSLHVNLVYSLLPDINRELNDSLRTWFISNLLGDFYINSKYREVKLVADSLQKIYHFEENQKAALAKSEGNAWNRYQKMRLHTLKAGDKATDFYLQDQFKKTYTLKGLGGKELLLCFYNKTIYNSRDTLSEKQWSGKVSSSVYQRLNIILDMNAPNELAENKSHIPLLFCKGKWGEILTTSYGLEDLPYIVLVNPFGILTFSGSQEDFFKFLTQNPK